jgi:hypothetical protein
VIVTVGPPAAPVAAPAARLDVAEPPHPQAHRAATASASANPAWRRRLALPRWAGRVRCIVPLASLSVPPVNSGRHPPEANYDLQF